MFRRNTKELPGTMARTKQEARKGTKEPAVQKQAYPPAEAASASSTGGDSTRSEASKLSTPPQAAAVATKTLDFNEAGSSKLESKMPAQKTKGKKMKKGPGPMAFRSMAANMEDMFVESNESVKSMGDELQAMNLEQQQDTEGLERKASFSEPEYAVKKTKVTLLKKAKAVPKAEKEVVTIGPENPLPQLSQMQPDSDYILDFTGNAEVSDAVLSSMANLPFMNRDSVIGIRLTGCHFVTDVGVALMADIFHNLKKLTLSGCPNVTETSLVVIMEKCSFLESLEIAGTNVAVLPRKLIGLSLVTDCAPVASPLPSEMKSTPQPSTDMAKACIICREGQTSLSVLRLLQGDKDLTLTVPVGFKPNFPCGKDTLLNLIECSQSTLDLFTHGWGVYIIPSELTDKTKIDEEAKSIFSVIMSVLAKTGGGSFVLLGMQSPKVGIVPTDVVMEKVQALAKDVLCTRELKQVSTGVDAAASVSEQQRLDQLEQQRFCLKNLNVSALEINVDDKAKAIGKVKEHLEAQVAKNPESKLFCKALGEYMKGFPEQGGKDLKVGIHTVNGAAELLLQGSAFSTLMQAQGAVLYLTKMGKISCYKQCKGNSIYADTSFLCQLLCGMSDGLPKTDNHTRDIAISDKTKVMMPDEFAERAGKVKVTVDLLWQLIKDLEVVGLQGQLGEVFIPYATLLEQPDISLDRFDKAPSTIQATYMFVLPFPVPPSLWYKAMSLLTSFHWPLHMWRQGLVMQHGIAELLIKCEGYSITLICQTVHAESESGPRCVTLLWQCVEQYKLLLDQVFICSGLIPKVACDSDKPKPDGITGLVNGHSLSTDDRSCLMCGETAKNMALMVAADAVVHPRLLSDANVYFTLFDEVNRGGKIIGSNILLESGGRAYINAALNGFEKQTCTIIFNSTLFDQLNLSLCSLSKQVTVMFGDKDTISLLRKTAKKGPKLLGQPVPGVSINITFCPTADNNVDCVVDCRGEVLSQQTLPADWYRIDFHFREQYQQAKGQAPRLGNDRIQFTVISQTFGRVANAGLKKGMRLEAKDRLNPSLICVATIEDIKPEQRGKGGPLLIHFDGWTSRYDYWAEEDSDDLHPIGYMEEVGHKDRRNRSDLQAPNKYNKKFDWLTYLKEVKAEPVPFSFFTQQQTRGTKPNKTVSLSTALGLASMPLGTSESTQSMCYALGSHTTTALEHWAKQQRGKSFKAASFLKINPRIFCMLPSGLDLKFLRYPALSTMFQVEKQSLHMLCCGQENRFHLVDHDGLKFSDVAKTYSGVEGFMQCAYLLLMHTGVMTVPLNMKHLCKGVADNIPLDQQPRLELGFQRLYHLYLMLFHFLDNSPGATKEFEDKEPKSLALDAEVSMQLKKVLTESAEQKETGFRDCFSFSAEFTKIQCKAHDAAQSGEKGLSTFPEILYDIGKTETLLNLYLFRNNLESLPANLSESFPSLLLLNVTDNKLTAMPSLSGFRNLSHLAFAKNQIKSVDFTANLGGTLQTLFISDNPINGLPQSLSNLSSLQTLNAYNIGVVKTLEPLCGLTKLDKLSLSYSVVSSLPDNFHECKLTSLRLAAIPLVKPRSSSGVEQLTMESLLKTYEQYTAVAQLPKDEKAALFVVMQGLSEEENIAKINARLIKRFPPLGGDKFPTALLKMQHLTRLDLSHQGFISVPDDIKNLSKLQELTLTGCYKLQTVPAVIATLPLEVLILNDCPSLKTPPREIVDRGFQAVYGYLRRLQMGSVDCKRTKLMMVGLGGAGKTSLVRSLRTGRFSMDETYDEMITDGIDICEWDIPIKDEKHPLQYSVWDFAGQTVYYNTHQFFLSNRAVYLLLWNIRLGYEHAGLDFWLSSIACHAPKAPVLVVGTHYDKVSKSHIPEVELKRRFPQIHSFHFVSSYTGHGLAKLREDLVAVTLTQKYMGEKIPEVWLNLEKQLISIRDKNKKALLPWKEVEEAGHRSGIFDKIELTQAVQFLHDLGSVQFFNTEFLRSNVVIVPQWIVDVMACVVTVHDGPIKNGLLNHEDLEVVWEAYPKELHPWLLRLTEEFDLTFCLPDKAANIIPCLLPDAEPKYKWPTVKRDSGEREMKMIYKFDYLPAGLFNRAQVRLHEFSDSSVLWKKGSMLKKNQHTALVLQTGTVEVVAKAQGFKPENVLFLIHEVFECLIAESYSGVHYDYFIPCMECQSQSQSEACMFPRSKVLRAVEFKAPFLQCDSFHIMSIPEILAIMPPDHNSDFDDHLRRGVHELNSLEEDVVISVFVCYSRKNVPTLAEEGKMVHPANILEDLRAASYKVSFTDDPENANMEALTMTMKSAQVVIIGISDEFLSNKQCYSIIFYARETLKKPILLVTLGKTANWQKQDINFLLGNEVYVKMQDITRYPAKIKELVAAVKTKAGIKSTETYPDCFISYCWKNSKTAVDLGTTSTAAALGWGDPRQIKKFLSDNGVTCWLDVEQMGQEGFYEDLARGVRTSKVVVAFVSDEYALSKTCRMEFQFATESVRIPVIVATVGTGYQWERSEIGMLAVGHDCPKVNLQFENKTGPQKVLEEVQKVLSKVIASSGAATKLSTSDQRKIAFQEAMELTQRKFLRQLVMYRTSTGHAEFPHLVLIDLIDKDKQDQGQEKEENMAEHCGESASEEQKCTAAEEGDDEDKAKAEADGPRMEEKKEAEVSDQYCFRVLCEWEQGWHEVPGSIPFPSAAGSSDNFLREVAPFVVRMMAILKHTSLPLPVLTLPQGEQLCKNFEEWSSRSSSEFQTAYKRLIDMIVKQDKQKSYGGLKRCHVTNGKQLWLCPEHSAKVGSVTEEVEVAAPTAVTYKNPNSTNVDDDDDGDDYMLKEEDEDPAPSPPPVPQTPKTTRRQLSGKTLSRTTSRACRIM